MRLVANADAEQWLFGGRGAVLEFDWDAGNLTKNRQHDVEPDDVAAVFAGDVYFAGGLRSPRTRSPAGWCSARMGEDAPWR